MNEININLNDNTTDGRFSQSNTAADVAKAATETKTAPATTTGSTPKPSGGGGGVSGNTAMDVVKSVGGQLYSKTPVATVNNKVQGVFAKGANPVAISLMALGLAKKAFDQWQQVQMERNEWRNTYAVQYGIRDGNMRNMRTTIITGKINGTPLRSRR